MNRVAAEIAIEIGVLLEVPKLRLGERTCPRSFASMSSRTLYALHSSGLPKQSFLDSGVPKQELGNEEVRGE
jgi:hypothetical protein